MPHDPSQSYEPSSDDSEKQPPFRFNAKVAQFLILVLLALGLPMTVAILGFIEMRKAIRHESQERTVDAAGLQEALEHAVDSVWEMPTGLGGPTNRFEVISRSGDECLRIGEKVKKVATLLGGSVITPERIEAGGTRWIIQLPTAQSRMFDETLESLGFQRLPSQASETPDDALLYELDIRITD